MTTHGFRTLVIVLLVLNIFLVGAVAGAGLAWVRSDTPAPGGTLRLAGEQLPREQRAAFRHTLRAVRQEAHPVIVDGQQARREAANLLQQPTLDQAALSAALERIRKADLTLRERVEHRAVEFAATLSLEERRLLAEGLVRRADPPAPSPAK